jgi:hypothetical protein
MENSSDNSARSPTFSTNIHTVFEFQLPFAIPVPDDVYEIYKQKKRIDLVIKRIQGNTGLEMSHGYIQMQNDRRVNQHVATFA